MWTLCVTSWGLNKQLFKIKPQLKQKEGFQLKPVKIALIGSGKISYTYLNTLTRGGFSMVDMVGCSDELPERSKARAEAFGIRQMTNEEILNDPEIEIVLNTTQMWNHHKVSRAILEAGKHVYSEKSMDTSFENAKVICDLAEEKGLRFAAAPDTYMGSAYQTARKLIDDGLIGIPLFANAICFRGYGYHERDGDFPFPEMGMKGTSIPYDMAGYYINALVSLLGSVKRVSGYSRFIDEREFTNPNHPRYGQKVDKKTGPTVAMGCLEFENNCYANMVMCAEGFGPEIPRVEIFGTEGILTLPDPNWFGGWGLDVYLNRIGNAERLKMPFTHGFSDADPSNPAISPITGLNEPAYNSQRGLGVVDMAWAIRRNRTHRNSPELALHAVEVLGAIDKSMEDNTVHTMQTRPGRPRPLAAGFFERSAEAAIDC